jgi:hypothetical protein
MPARCVAIANPDIEADIELGRQTMAAGPRIFKVKTGFASHAEDMRRLTRLREQLGDEFDLRIGIVGTGAGRQQQTERGKQGQVRRFDKAVRRSTTAGHQRACEASASRSCTATVGTPRSGRRWMALMLSVARTMSQPARRLAPMKRLAYYHWLIPDPLTGRMRKTRYRLPTCNTPGAQRLDWTREDRDLPETQEEFARLSASACLTGPHRHGRPATRQ